ncbi:RNA polymerase sigma-70 factor, ECF subfamily [Frankineae bacterium MT45]|nr:RNA polymerase sigma-70 factor, ECF subfamily [Frankineae bacterium MT45]
MRTGYSLGLIGFTVAVRPIHSRSARERCRVHRAISVVDDLVSNDLHLPTSDRPTHDPSVEPPTEFAARLFDEHAEPLLAYLSRRVGRAAAEDLVSDTFEVVLKDCQRFDAARGGERAWLFGVATNILRHHLRTETRSLRALHRHFPSGVTTTDHSQSVASQLDASRSVRQLLAALAELSPTDMDVLLLVAWGGLSPSEVADALGIPAGTARSRLHRVRRQLRVRAVELNIELMVGATE